jgi:hypothetical protein
MVENTNALAVVNGEGKLTAINSPVSCKDYIAAKLGLTLPKSTKDNPFTTKDAVELALTKPGVTKERIKELRKAHKAEVTQHYASSAVFMAAVSADPRFRKNARTSKDKDGNVNGWNFTVRKERSVSVGAASKIAQLEAVIAKLTAALALPAAPAA